MRDHEMVVLDGGHYLHWNRSPEIAFTTADFLAEHGIASSAETRVAGSATAG